MKNEIKRIDNLLNNESLKFTPLILQAEEKLNEFKFDHKTYQNKFNELKDVSHSKLYTKHFWKDMDSVSKKI